MAILTQSSRAVLPSIIGVAILLRMGMLLRFLSSHAPEAWEYEVLARNLLSGAGFIYRHHGVDYQAFVVPGFPALCALLHWLSGPAHWMYFAVQLAVAIGVIHLCYRIAWRLVSPSVAAIVAMLAALEPGLIVYQSYKIDPTAICQLLGLSCAYLLIPSPGKALPSMRACGLIGLAIGAGMLIRPDVIVLIASIPTLFFMAGPDFQAAIRRSAIIIAMIAAAFAPWVIRNHIAFGRFVPFSSISGENLWYGNNPSATGSAMTADHKMMYSSAGPELRARVERATHEFEVDALFREEARRYIAADIPGFCYRTLRKFWYFWWFTPTFGVQYRSLIPDAAQTLYKAWTALLLLLMAVGISVGLRSPPAAVQRSMTLFCSVVPLGLAAIHAVYYVEARHRLMILPLLLILAGCGLEWVRTRTRAWASGKSRGKA